MDAKTGESGVIAPAERDEGAVFAIIAGLSFCHCLNDLIQSLLPAIYPLLKEAYGLDFGQIGLITLTFQLTASLLQPVVGIYTDRRPRPFSLVVGMGFSLVGLVLLSQAASFGVIVLAAAMVGVGSAVFHPEASRIARLASGGRHGLAQSLFQVGGNFGQAIGPLLAALIVVPRGQGSVAWFSLAAFVGMACLALIGRWYRDRLVLSMKRAGEGLRTAAVSRRSATFAVVILVLIVFSKSFYTAAFTSYYTFYLIERFGVSVQEAQIHLFVFMGAIALGTVLGGPVIDLLGRKAVILVSVAGILPFTLVLPYVDLAWTVLLTVPIGLILASSFPAIIVFAQELLPGRIGVVSGLFFGLSFGMGGLGAALLGVLADRTSIELVFRVTAWLPAVGLLAVLLPDLRRAVAKLG